MTYFKKSYYKLGVAMTMGMLAASPAYAGGNPPPPGGGGGAGQNFSDIATNITTSLGTVPGVLTGVAYLFGVMLAILGVGKIKDHVENPAQTPLKDGAIKLLAGGALFALPMLIEAMTSTVGAGASTDIAKVYKIKENLL